MSDKEKATGGRGKQRQRQPVQKQQDGVAPRTGGRGKQRER